MFVADNFRVSAVCCVYTPGYAELLQFHLCEAEKLSMPSRLFLDTMTEWSGAAAFILYLWTGASDTWQTKGNEKSGNMLHLLRDLAYLSAVWAPSLNATIWLQNVGKGRKDQCMTGLLLSWKVLKQNLLSRIYIKICCCFSHSWKLTWKQEDTEDTFELSRSNLQFFTNSNLKSGAPLARTN